MFWPTFKLAHIPCHLSGRILTFISAFLCNILLEEWFFSSNVHSSSPFLSPVFLLVLAEGMALDDEDEGEQFDFDDSGDDVPEADRPPPAPPAPDYTEQGTLGGECPPPPEDVAPLPAQPHPNPTAEASQGPTMTTTTTDAAFPPPPPPEESCEAPSSVTTNPATPASTSAASEAPSNAPAPETDLPPPPPEEATATVTDPAPALDAGQKGAWTTAVNCVT